MEKERKDERVTVLKVELVLIILILILFLFIQCLGLIEHKGLVPTGNVDIFDINFGDTSCSTDSKKGEDEDTTIPVFKEEPKFGGIEVFDDDKSYSTTTKLNIFTQTSYYVVNNRIAPTSENTYQFVIRNNSNFTIKYSLEMLEDNDYNINMRYRLKQNGKYIVGSDDEYVTADKLVNYDKILSRQIYDTYSLDWKWFEGDNDTEIGTNVDSYYQLNIKITASEY